MKKINYIQAAAFIMGMVCINSSAISQYIFPMHDFINGVIKGIGIGLLVYFIAQIQSKKKRPKTNQ